jgi:hypothetical protein
MRYKRFAAGLCAAVLMGISAGPALGGEVKGPPTGGSPNTNFNTKATDHANSVCVFSGLNDFTTGPQNQTQTPADFAPGSAGHGLDGVFPIGCRGGSNPDNPPTG